MSAGTMSSPTKTRQPKERKSMDANLQRWILVALVAAILFVIVAAVSVMAVKSVMDTIEAQERIRQGQEADKKIRDGNYGSTRIFGSQPK